MSYIEQLRRSIEWLKKQERCEQRGFLIGDLTTRLASAKNIVARSKQSN